jgi:hypothetical protein
MSPERRDKIFNAEYAEDAENLGFKPGKPLYASASSALMILSLLVVALAPQTEGDVDTPRSKYEVSW